MTYTMDDFMSDTDAMEAWDDQVLTYLGESDIGSMKLRDIITKTLDDDYDKIMIPSDITSAVARLKELQLVYVTGIDSDSERVALTARSKFYFEQGEILKEEVQEEMDAMP